MAAPPEKTLENLTGKWTMNRKYSSDVDPVLQIQGFSALSRTAIAHAPVYLKISQTSDKTTIEQSTTAKIPAITEQWPYDWQERETKDLVMGVVRSKARWVKVGDGEVQGEDAAWLTGDGWLSEGNGEDGKQVEAWVDADGGWTAHHLWGFEKYDDQRYFVRRVAVRAKDGGGQARVTLVYDFDG